MPRANAKKPKKTVQRQSPIQMAQAERWQLNQRMRIEREIVRLSDALERAVRKSDRRLVELGAALMQRGARVNRAEAGLDVAREDAIRDRSINPAD